jgi:mRNA-degrading endonuclease toxin of MazEF toxin-antitoxin module
MRVLIKAGEGGVREDCWAKCDQVMTLPKILVQYPAKGSLTSEILRKIEEQVRIALSLLQDDGGSR